MKTRLLKIILFCAIASVRLSAYAQDVREADIHENGTPALTFGLINPERTHAGVGQAETITIQVCDANGKKAAGARVRFSASGTAVIDDLATADENGIASAQLAIGVEYPGIYSITVSSEDFETGGDASMQFLVHLDSDGDGLRDVLDCWPIARDYQSCYCLPPGEYLTFTGDTLSMYSSDSEIDRAWHQITTLQDIGDPQSCPRIPADVFRGNIDAILRDISASLDISGHEKSVNRLASLGHNAAPYLIDRLSDYEHPDMIADALWVIADVERIPNLMDYLASIESLTGREYEVDKLLRLFDKLNDDYKRVTGSHDVIESYYIGERESDILYDLFLISDGNETIKELLESLLCRYGEGAPADYIYRHIKEKYHRDSSAFYCP